MFKHSSGHLKFETHPYSCHTWQMVELFVCLISSHFAFVCTAENGLQRSILRGNAIIFCHSPTAHMAWYCCLCSVFVIVCQLGCDNNHNTRFQQKAYKPWSPHCMLFGEAVLVFVSQIAWAISHYLKLCFPTMTPTGKDSLQCQDYFAQFGTGRFCCRSLSNME